MPAKTPKTTPGASYMRGRPTLYKGIRMRSRIEAEFAAFLDREKRQWQYEPVCLADEHGQWLPDFRVEKLAGYPLSETRLVEVKPAEMLSCAKGENVSDVIDRVDKVIQRVAPAWACEPEITVEIDFWRYGAEEPELSLTSTRTKPWTAWVPGLHLPLLWIGAGQTEAIGIWAEVTGDVLWPPRTEVAEASGAR